MNLSEPFIRRPIATSLLMAGVVLMGMLGYFLLPVSALPPVDFPTIQVTALFPGAGPEVMASSVTTPLERQFGQISGLSMMTSISSFGNSSITLQFNLDRDRRGRTGCAGGDERGQWRVAAHAQPAHVQQSQPGGYSHSYTRDYVGHLAAGKGE